MAGHSRLAVCISYRFFGRLNWETKIEPGAS